VVTTVLLYDVNSAAVDRVVAYDHTLRRAHTLDRLDKHLVDSTDFAEAEELFCNKLAEAVAQRVRIQIHI